MTVPPRLRSPRFTLSAAGFIATSTSGASPGVRMSWSARWIWNDETPGSVPCGARISAGKFGSVARSLPNTADSCANRSPVSCMPSPESPAKRMTTLASSSTPDALVSVAVTRPSLGRKPLRRGDVRGMDAVASRASSTAGSVAEMSDSRPADLQRQAREHAERARTTMDERRSEASDGVSGWVADRAGEWSTRRPGRGDDAAPQVPLERAGRLLVPDGDRRVGEPARAAGACWSASTPGRRSCGTPGPSACSGGAGSARSARCTAPPTTC